MGNPQDDFCGPIVSLLSDTEAFALSWKALSSPASCSITKPALLCPHNREGRYQSLAFSGLLSACDRPFWACDEPAKAEVHMENCAYNHYATGH